MVLLEKSWDIAFQEIHEKIADYTYDLIPLTKHEFHTFMKQKDFAAINVTIPYKKDVIPYLDEMDMQAKSIGAVNTIVNKNGKLIGHNTDFDGFLYMVRHHNIHMKIKKFDHRQWRCCSGCQSGCKA